MKAKLLSIAFLVLLAPGLCLALMVLSEVTAERARELGMEIRSRAAGPDAVWVEVEFPVKGELMDFNRVDLEMRDGAKLLFSSSLHADRSQPGRVTASFHADRASLGKFKLRVVTVNGLHIVGHDIRLRDFVDLEKLR